MTCNLKKKIVENINSFILLVIFVFISIYMFKKITDKRSTCYKYYYIVLIISLYEVFHQIYDIYYDLHP